MPVGLANYHVCDLRRTGRETLERLPVQLPFGSEVLWFPVQTGLSRPRLNRQQDSPSAVGSIREVRELGAVAGRQRIGEQPQFPCWPESPYRSSLSVEPK